MGHDGFLSQPEAERRVSPLPFGCYASQSRGLGISDVIVRVRGSSRTRCGRGVDRWPSGPWIFATARRCYRTFARYNAAVGVEAEVQPFLDGRHILRVI